MAEISALVARLLRVRAARGSLWGVRMLFLVLGGVVLAVVSIAASLAGVRLAVLGLNGGLTAALDGRPWLADLCSGLVVLACTALLIASIHSWLQRRILRGLKTGRGGADDPS